MIRLLLMMLFTLVVTTSCEERNTLDEGYEWISNEGRAHFIWVGEEHLGDKVSQRNAGRIICTKMFQHGDYCEVYMWSDKEDVPKGFPLINRRTMIGKFEMKNGEVKLNPLRQ